MRAMFAKSGGDECSVGSSDAGSDIPAPSSAAAVAGSAFLAMAATIPRLIQCGVTNFIVGPITCTHTHTHTHKK